MATERFSESSSQQGPAYPQFAGEAGSLIDQTISRGQTDLATKLANIDTYMATLRALQTRMAAQARGATSRGGGVNPQAQFRAGLEQAAQSAQPMEAQIAQMLLAKNASYDSVNALYANLAGIKAQLSAVQQGTTQSTTRTDGGGAGGSGGRRESSQSTSANYPGAGGNIGFGGDDSGSGWGKNYRGFGPGPNAPNPGFLGSSPYAVAGTNQFNTANMKARMAKDAVAEQAAREGLGRRYASDSVMRELVGGIMQDIGLENEYNTLIQGIGQMGGTSGFGVPSTQSGPWNQWNNLQVSPFESQFSAGPPTYIDPARAQAYLNTPMGTPLIDPYKAQQYLTGGVPPTNWNAGGADWNFLTGGFYDMSGGPENNMTSPALASEMPPENAPAPSTVIWHYDMGNPGAQYVEENPDWESQFDSQV